MLRFQIAVYKEDQPVDGGKKQPRDEEARCDEQEVPAPLGVDHGCKVVLEEFFDAIGTVCGNDVDEAVFEYCSFVTLECCVFIVALPVQQQYGEYF